jgi:GT2 family glycosyltransferase
MGECEARFGKGSVVVTGLERKSGELVNPQDQSFLGFQNKPYLADEGLNSIVINSTMFPTELVKRLQFDERLRYGYEEVEISTRIVAAGGTIVRCSDAINDHFPSPLGRDDYEFDGEVARLYATYKRYSLTERRRARALAFGVIAPVHAVLAGGKARGLRGMLDANRASLIALKYARVAAADNRATTSCRRN